MSARVRPSRATARRATRRRRCARCGFTAVYENASVVAADYWFGRHSCQRQERLMVRAALGQQRRDLVDRTPQPCLHKVADHQHGTRACYVLDRCRCEPCSKANAKAESERERQKAYGRYHKYVNAEHVRAHLAELAEYGIGLKRVSALSGVSNGSLTKIVYGTYAKAEGPSKGRYGAGALLRGPARRVLRRTAEAIFAIEAVPANLNPSNPDRERTSVARLHLQALVALGWSQAKLAKRLGMLPTNLGPVIGTSAHGGPNARPGLRILSRATVDAIEQLYAELSMTLPPETNQRERIAASRARNYAKARGWLPPLMLEVVDPLASDEEYLDEVAVQRRVNGDKTVGLTAAERRACVRQLHARKAASSTIAKTLGYNFSTVADDLRSLGLAPNPRENLHPVSSEHFSGRGRARREAQRETS